jgi:hypothetical protein
MVARSPSRLVDQAESAENRVLRQIEAAAARAWRESTTVSVSAQCPGYLKLHKGVNGTVECFWCPECDEAAR